MPANILFAPDFVGVEEACVVDVPFPLPDVAVEPCTVEVPVLVVSPCVVVVAVSLVAVELAVGGAVAWIN